jgi:hypothetical protein
VHIALKNKGKLAHPTRFERVTFAFGGQRLGAQTISRSPPTISSMGISTSWPAATIDQNSRLTIMALRNRGAVLLIGRICRKFVLLLIESFDPSWTVAQAGH